MKISFLASHGGSSARHIINAIHGKKLAAEIGIVVTNNRDSVIYRWCHDNDIEVFYISGKTHPNSAMKDQAMHEALSAAGTDIIVLSGYMKKVGAVTLSAYTNKILNIHPSLLPRHGGKGLYGDRVHEAVLLSGDRESGATVQFVNEEYDEGPIIAQHKITISPHETPQSLKAKVQAIEGELYLSSIQKILRDQ
ncbi:phosphoribosylglycinamide formyltransferase [Gammaproteobacteria bacterium 54_18_T64]|nr:phosphoribosylglycinamide formyltransferase [Gammaproteobacteria bacterium 54_18_T64]